MSAAETRLPFPSLGYAEPVVLVPLDGVNLDRPADRHELVMAIIGHGIPAAQEGNTVSSTQAFSAAWAKRCKRIRADRLPTRGARMRKTVTAIAESLRL